MLSNPIQAATPEIRELASTAGKDGQEGTDANQTSAMAVKQMFGSSRFRVGNFS
jgi:hypothetical protein